MVKIGDKLTEEEEEALLTSLMVGPKPVPERAERAEELEEPELPPPPKTRTIIPKSKLFKDIDFFSSNARTELESRISVLPDSYADKWKDDISKAFKFIELSVILKNSKFQKEIRRKAANEMKTIAEGLKPFGAVIQQIKTGAAEETKKAEPEGFMEKFYKKKLAEDQLVFPLKQKYRGFNSMNENKVAALDKIRKIRKKSGLNQEEGFYKDGETHVERPLYISDENYLAEVNQQIVKEKNEFIKLKYDILYDLTETMDNYDKLEGQVKQLEQLRSNIIRKMKNEKETQTREHETAQQIINEKVQTYKFMEDVEERKVLYKEIMRLNKKLVTPRSLLKLDDTYVLVPDYNPIKESIYRK